MAPHQCGVGGKPIHARLGQPCSCPNHASPRRIVVRAKPDSEQVHAGVSDRPGEVELAGEVLKVMR
jgi:hypothetical protein